MSTWLATTTWPFLGCWADSTINVGANIHVVQWANGNWLPSTHFQLGSIDWDSQGACFTFRHLPVVIPQLPSLFYSPHTLFWRPFSVRERTSLFVLMVRCPKIDVQSKINARRDHMAYLTFKPKADILVLVQMLRHETHIVSLFSFPVPLSQLFLFHDHFRALTWICLVL